MIRLALVCSFPPSYHYDGRELIGLITVSETVLSGLCYNFHSVTSILSIGLD